MGPQQYDNAGGMLIVVLAVIVLTLLCRWVFSTTDRDRRAARARAAAAAAGDYGLLVPITTVRTVADAESLREVLASQGIRATVGRGEAGEERVVMVFRRDEQAARSVVG